MSMISKVSLTTAAMVAAFAVGVAHAETMEAFGSTVIRSQPLLSAPATGGLKKGERVEAEKHDKLWYRVTAGNTKGYVYHELLRPVRVAQKVAGSTPVPVVVKGEEGGAGVSPVDPGASSDRVVEIMLVPESENDFRAIREEVSSLRHDITQFQVQLADLRRALDTLRGEQEKLKAESAKRPMSLSERLVDLVDTKGERVKLKGVGEARYAVLEGKAVIKVSQDFSSKTEALFRGKAEKVARGDGVYFICDSKLVAL